MKDKTTQPNPSQTPYTISLTKEYKIKEPNTTQSNPTQTPYTISLTKEYKNKTLTVILKSYSYL